MGWVGGRGSQGWAVRLVGVLCFFVLVVFWCVVFLFVASAVFGVL